MAETWSTAAGRDVDALIIRLHGNALRLISDKIETHFSGLRAAAAACRRQRLLPGNLLKKLTRVDDAFTVIRHLTNASATTFLNELDSAFSGFDGKPTVDVRSDNSGSLILKKLEECDDKVHDSMGKLEKDMQSMGCETDNLGEKVGCTDSDLMLRWFDPYMAEMRKTIGEEYSTAIQNLKNNFEEEFLELKKDSCRKRVRFGDVV